MAINKEQFEMEKESLDNTMSWLEKEIVYLEDSEENIDKKVLQLKKESKGKYNIELQSFLKIQGNLKDKVINYKESKDKPYFAKIDFKEKLRDEESFYIGKIGLTDEREKEERVIDWRAPIADLYYSGTEGEASYQGPYGEILGELLLKRKFLIKESELIDVFDEGKDQIILRSLNSGEEGEELEDEFLRIALEESSNTKLKDIVATIQKEQNDIIRSEKNKVIIVQGSAGSGKTTIALHRLAYLLYKYKNKIEPEEVLVLAPNKLFLNYISEVLPNLGGGDVPQRTFEDWAMEILKIKMKLYNKDQKLSYIIENSQEDDIKHIVNGSKLKGSILFKTILDRYIKYVEFSGISYENISVGDYVIFSRKEIKELIVKNLKYLPLQKRVEELKRYFNAQLKNRLDKIINGIEKEYDYLLKSIRNSDEEELIKREKLVSLYDEKDEKIDNIKKDSKKALKNFFSNLGKIDVLGLYYNLFEDEDLYLMMTDELIPKALWDYLRDELKNNIENKILDRDDLASLLYLKLKLQGNDYPLYKYMVVDEGQDYSKFEVFVLNSSVVNDAFTIVGDVGQSIYYYRGINRWDGLIKDVYKGEGEYIPLSQSYRSTIEIVNFANKVLTKQENFLKPAKPVLRHGMEPAMIKYNEDLELVKILNEISKEVKDNNKKTIALIGKDMKECKEIQEKLVKNKIKGWKLIKEDKGQMEEEKIIIPSYMTKGLEFDCAIVYNCNKNNYSDNELDKKLLYVVLTRALHMEYVLYKDEISELLL